MNTSFRRPKTKILVDGGDPQETVRVRDLVGLVDGQTTNPTLIAKNPDVRGEISSGHKFTSREELDEYKKIVQTIAPLVGDAGVSIEVFSDFDTTAEEMFAQGKEMFSWVPNAYVKYPCTHEGLRAAQMSVDQAIRVNITLCFSQQQAAAVYAVTKRSKQPVYVSPFLGRLDDRGENGMDVVANIKKGQDKSGNRLRPIPYKPLDLSQPWETFDIRHELTTKGIQQFVADYKSTLKQSA